MKKLLKSYVVSDGITQSMLASFLECRQKSRFKLDGWQTGNSTSHSMDRGNLIHSLLEGYYGHERTFNPSLIWNQEIEHWKSNLPITTNPKDTIETLSQVGALWPAYCKYWDTKDSRLIWKNRCEEVFNVNFNGFRLRGKFDGVPILHTPPNKVNPNHHMARYLFETKSKAYIEEQGLMDQLTFDFQNLYYLTALETMGTPAVGVIYNIIRKPLLKKGKAESDLEFSERVAEDINLRPSFYFKRYEISYTQRTLLDFQGDLLKILTEFKSWIEGKLPTYKNTTACVGKGNMKCEFLGACSSGTLIGYKRDRILFRELTPVSV